MTPPTLQKILSSGELLQGGSFSQKVKKRDFWFLNFGKGDKKVERKEELMKLVQDSNELTIIPLIDKMLYLENQLESLEKLPMIKVNPDNPMQQKATPAAKLYKEFLQQYVNVVKVVAKATGAENEQEISPLRAWVESRMDITGVI